MVKLVLFAILIVFSKGYSQKFGKTEILVYPSVSFEAEMLFNNWYEHPLEEDIYIVNFQNNFFGLQRAFDEVNSLLSQNEMGFEIYFHDESTFENGADSIVTLEQLHSTIVKEKASILRTWRVNNDYLTVMFNSKIYLVILGNQSK